MTSGTLKEAVALARQGEKDQARRILAEIIQDDVHNEMAWLWYVDTMPAADAQVRALQECLYHNPGSEAAKRGLERLGERWEETSYEVTDQAGVWLELEPEPEPEPMPELEPEPPPRPRPQTEPVRPMYAPKLGGAADVVETARPAGGGALVLGIIAALVGAIVLGYVGLFLVTGWAITSLADLQEAVATTTGLIAALVGLVVGAAVGTLIARALVVRSRRAD